VPVDFSKYQQPAQAPAQQTVDFSKYQQPSAPQSPPESHPISDFVGNFVDAVNPLPTLKHYLVDLPQQETQEFQDRVQHGDYMGAAKAGLRMLPGVDLASDVLSSQGNQFKKAAADLSNTREMPALSDRLMSAGGHALAGALPLIGPAAAEAGEQIGSGDVAGGLGRGAGLIASTVLGPKVAEGAGRLIKAPAPAIAEKAIGISKADRGFGANPGQGILEDTRGIRPSTIANSAQRKINTLTPELERRAAASKQLVSLAPARKVLSDRIAAAEAANSEAGPAEVRPMLAQLTEPRKGFAGATHQPPAPLVQVPSNILGPNGQPVMTTQPGGAPMPVISEMQTPSTLLKMKREFGKDFSRFKPGVSTKEGISTANKAYHAMADEFNNAVPGGAQLNRRIQNLVPVARAAESTSRNEGLIPHVMTRLERPTGGMVPALIGYSAGGGPGAALAATVPEIVSTPSVRMIGARGLYGLGKGLGSPVTANATRIAPLVRINRAEEQ
jgi:hypothetical protein